MATSIVKPCMKTLTHPKFFVGLYRSVIRIFILPASYYNQNNMNPFILLLAATIISISANSQTICGTAGEGGTVVLNAPPGKYFTSINFASYGTPNGSCGSFTIGGCHASNSLTIVQNAVIGRTTASISATNGVFGDPCGGTVKRLYVEAVYSSILPQKLLAFSAFPQKSINLLQWETTEEINTSHFEIEYSSNGVQFTKAGQVSSKNTPGKHLYSFTDNRVLYANTYYRLKMVDRDEKYVYSQVIKVENNEVLQLNFFPNPVTNSFTISGLKPGLLLEVLSIQGKVLQQIKTSGLTQKISVSDYAPGIYMIRVTGNIQRGTYKIVKR